MVCISFLAGDRGRGGVFPYGSAGKESAYSAGDLGSIPGLGNPLEKEMAYLLQYSCLGNSMDRGAWQAAVHGNAESATTKRLHFHFLSY